MANHPVFNGGGVPRNPNREPYPAVPSSPGRAQMHDLDTPSQGSMRRLIIKDDDCYHPARKKESERDVSLYAYYCRTQQSLAPFAADDVLWAHEIPEYWIFTDLCWENCSAIEGLVVDLVLDAGDGTRTADGRDYAFDGTQVPLVTGIDLGTEFKGGWKNLRDFVLAAPADPAAADNAADVTGSPVYLPDTGFVGVKITAMPATGLEGLNFSLGVIGLCHPRSTG